MWLILKLVVEKGVGLSYIIVISHMGFAVHNREDIVMTAPGGHKNSKAVMLGLGLDNKDEHKRITKGDNFYLVGGSEETHEKMTETAIKVNEKLAARGKHLEEVSPGEFADILAEASDK